MRAATSTLGARRNCINCSSVRRGISEKSIPESSPAACLFAIRDKTVFCALPTGLVKIDSALTLVCFPGRDAADDFFFVILSLPSIKMHNQQHCARNGSYGVPPLFALCGAVFSEN